MEMLHKNSLSVAEKLLLAAHDLEKQGRRPFSAEDLVISAWRRFPDAFGLAGYHDESGQLRYPNSNRVFAEIMGSKPIRKKGLLIKVSRRMYQLTEAGQEQVKLLQERRSKTHIKRAGLARETEKELKRLFASKALDKFRNNRSEELTFYDACAFWGISPRSSAIELEGRIANLLAVVESARRIANKKMISFEHSGFAFGDSDLNVVLKVHQELLDRFQNEISTIQKRKQEWA